MDYLYLYCLKKENLGYNSPKKIKYPDYVLKSDYSIKNALKKNDKNLLKSLLIKKNSKNKTLL